MSTSLVSDYTHYILFTNTDPADSMEMNTIESVIVKPEEHT